MNNKNILGFIIVLIGVSMLIPAPFFNILFALLIIWIGVRMMGKSWRFEDYKQEVSSDEVDNVFIFSPVNKVLTSDNFKGGQLTCVFAGGVVDMSKLKSSTKEINLEVNNIFGGIKLILPKNWKLSIKESNFAGGIDNKSKGAGSTTLNLKGSSVFGGMEITN